MGRWCDPSLQETDLYSKKNEFSISGGRSISISSLTDNLQNAILRKFMIYGNHALGKDAWSHWRVEQRRHLQILLPK